MSIAKSLGLVRTADTLAERSVEGHAQHSQLVLREQGLRPYRRTMIPAFFRALSFR